MILDFANKWNSGDVIGVKFLNGNAKLHKRVEAAANEWEKFANIIFDFSSNSNGIIRIKFGGGKNDSKIGSDALTYPIEVETMTYANLHDNSSDDDLIPTVQHEFGHALGLIHEHFHPFSTVKLNEKATTKHFMSNYGFSEADVRQNLLRKYNPNMLSLSEFDPNSIMIYDIDSSCTTDGSSFTQPDTLSELDKTFISSIYPQTEQSIELLTPGNALPFSIGELLKQQIYKFELSSNNSLYQIETQSNKSVALSIYRIENEGLRKGYVDYIKPFGDHDSIGTNASIELDGYAINVKPDIKEYFVKISSEDNSNIEGEVNIKFS